MTIQQEVKNLNPSLYGQINSAIFRLDNLTIDWSVNDKDFKDHSDLESVRREFDLLWSLISEWQLILNRSDDIDSSQRIKMLNHLTSVIQSRLKGPSSKYRFHQYRKYPA